MSDQRAHSRFGGSSAARWLTCAGSVALTRDLPDFESKYAREGTAAHRLAEICLQRRCHPNAFIGGPLLQEYGVEVTSEMADAVVTYLNALETEQAQTPDSVLLVEQGFTIELDGFEQGEVFGTNDALVFHPQTGRLRVFDYKHGAGTFVDVTDNSQLKFYALGAVLANPAWKVREIILTVVQPRSRDSDEAVRDFPMDRVDLLDFQEDIRNAILKAKAYERDGHGQGVFVAGAHCDKTWCAAKRAGVCPAQWEVLKDNFEGVVPVRDPVAVTPADLPKPADLDTAQLARVVGALDLLNGWAQACREYLEALILNGTEVPGWKAVEKVGRAKWVDDPAKIAGWASMMFDVDPAQMLPPKLVTITEAEKLLKAAGATKADIDELKLKFTIKESSGLTIAPASDRRPAVDRASELFAGVKL